MIKLVQESCYSHYCKAFKKQKFGIKMNFSSGINVSNARVLVKKHYPFVYWFLRSLCHLNKDFLNTDIHSCLHSLFASYCFRPESKLSLISYTNEWQILENIKKWNNQLILIFTQLLFSFIWLQFGPWCQRPLQQNSRLFL